MIIFFPWQMAEKHPFQKKKGKKRACMQPNMEAEMGTERSFAFKPILISKHNITLSAQNHKGVITIKRCSVERQKGAIAIDFVQQ